MTTIKIKKIGVFCGSNIGNDELYAKTARHLAECMVNAGTTLIYGGAKVGLMGTLADHILKNNGQAIGVIPQSLVDVETAHENLTELHVVTSMPERKTLIAEMSDGFIMLPGGPGSLDEFFEMFTYAQLGYHSKPCGILNICNYYDYLLKFLDHAVTQGFLKSVHRNMVIVEQSPQELIQKLNEYQAPSVIKWIKEQEISQLPMLESTL